MGCMCKTTKGPAGEGRCSIESCGTDEKVAEKTGPREAGYSPLDIQVGGGHYKNMPIQPVEFIYRNEIPFIEACCIKYLCRHREKGGAEDLKKVIHFCQMLIQLEYESEPTD